MEQRTVSGKIPAELYERFRAEMDARGWTMSAMALNFGAAHRAASKPSLCP